MFDYRNRSVGAQLKLALAACFVTAFVVLAIIVYQSAYKALLDTTLTAHQESVEGLAKVIAGEYDSLLESAKKFEASFRGGYLKGMQVNGGKKTFHGMPITDLSLHGQSLAGNNSLVDSFKESTGILATIFAASGNDFVRISSSLKNQQGQRVIGTKLGFSHPGYSKLINGHPYDAKVKLFGKKYITYYHPIFSQNGTVAGISFIGLPVDQVTDELFHKLREISWGKTGDTVILDNADNNKGRYLLHPRLTEADPSILQVKATNGKPLFASLFASDNGVLIYPWQSDGKVQDKYYAYAHIKGWDWKLAAGTYVNEVTEASRNLLILIALVSFAIAIVSFALITWLLNRTTRPLVVVSDSMSRLGQGEVSIQVAKGDDSSNNEIVLLKNQMSDMAGHLNQLVNNIREASDSLHEQAASVFADSQQTMTQMDDQQKTVDSVVTAIEEMAQSAKDVATQIELIASGVQHAETSGQSGVKVVDAVTDSMHQLKSMLDGSAVAIAGAAQDSEKIQQVTNIINEIAEQTNLLALNAAIEAARAGEQGRGFAVVADEVRTLASRTQASVADVSAIINSLQSSTKGAVKLMQQSQDNATQVLDKANEASMELAAIGKQMGEVSIQSQAISATTEQQAMVAQNIAQSVSNISKLNQQATHLSARSASSAEILQSHSVELKQRVDYFH